MLGILSFGCFTWNYTVPTPLSIHRSFWCNIMEFTKKKKSPNFRLGEQPMGTLIFWWIQQHYTKNTNVYYRKHNFVRILCIWLFWKTLTWLVYQILDDFCRKLNFVRILCIWLIWKTLTWLLCRKGLTFFKSPWNILPRSTPSGSPSARRFGDFDYFLVVLHPIFLCIPCLLKGSRATKKDLVFGLAISAFRLSTVGRP